MKEPVIPRFKRWLLGPLVDAPAEVRAHMLSTILQTQASLFLTSLTILLICGTAAAVSGAVWAWVWALGSLGVIAWRALYPQWCAQRAKPVSLTSIMVTSAILFAGFGLGAAACVVSGNPALITMGLAGAIGIVAGLASRWAALPRPAIITMVLTVLPVCAVLAWRGGPEMVAALAAALVVISIANFTVQNQRNLLAAIMAEETNLKLARTDSLTGLANRAELSREMADACAELQRSGSGRLAVLYLDLDGFKAVNDTHGHAAGDELLRQVANWLREIVGPNQTIARIGGDEFIVLLRQAGAEVARATADRIIARISGEHQLSDGKRIKVGCSAGVCVAPDQGNEPALLMSRADAALYAAKSRGKGQSGIWKMLVTDESLPATTSSTGL